MRAVSVAAIIFSLILSASASAAPCDGFVDVDGSNATYCAAVTFMKNKGITVGCTNSSHYCPNDYVTRLQMALFLERMGKDGPDNTLGDYTTTIGGGDFNSVNTVSGSSSTVGGGGFNAASGITSTVAGGYVNTASSDYGTVAGGWQNTAGAGEANTVGGGYQNTASGFEVTVGGGFGNAASNSYSTIAGGSSNLASGFYSTVAGGHRNEASGLLSFAAGNRAKATTNGSFIWADSQGFDFAPSVDNFFGVRATGGWASRSPSMGPAQ